MTTPATAAGRAEQRLREWIRIMTLHRSVTTSVELDLDDALAEARQQERERIRAAVENLVPFEPRTLAAADEMFFDPDADALVDWHEVLAILDAPEAQK